MATPAQVEVWAGLDVGKKEHFADVLDNDGERLFARAVRNDQGDLEVLLDHAARHGTPGLVIDQPGSIAKLALAVAARRGVPVAYVPGLVMRRAADLYPGEAKTDRRDAYVLADTGRTRRKQVHWLDAASDELLAQLRVLNGFDIDLAADATRLANRLCDALTSISPALERALGERLGQPGVRDLLAKYPALYLFAGRRQKLVVRRTYQDDFARAARKADLPAQFIPHSLRYYFASTALARSIPITDVSQWLGHRSIEVTYRIYRNSQELHQTGVFLQAA